MGVYACVCFVTQSCLTLFDPTDCSLPVVYRDTNSLSCTINRVSKRGLLRIPWTTRKSSQSILKEINTEYSLEVLMLKLKLRYFGPLM